MTANKNICRRRKGDGFNCSEIPNSSSGRIGANITRRISNCRGFLGSSNIELKESSVCANFAHTAYTTDKDKVFGAVLYLNK